jgi:hypothetical protein
MRVKSAKTSSIQHLKEEEPKILKQAKRGDRTAKKTLRNAGLVYWEHAGRVIVERVRANGGEGNGVTPWSFSYRRI